MVDIDRKRGSLFILKLFLTSKLHEQISYVPSYLEQGSNLANIKFRVENQGYESQRFKALFKKAWHADH